MRVNLTRLEIGQVSIDAPGQVLMSTDATSDEAIVPGFINKNQRYSSVVIKPTDFIYGSCADGLNIFIPLFGAGGIITLDPIASDVIPPAEFNYVNVWFVAQNGDDTNIGTNMAAPKLTFAAAIAAAEDSAIQTNVRKVIVGLDSGTYSTNFTISQLNLDIYAPNALIANCAITVAAPASTGIAGQSGNNLTFGRWQTVSYIDSSTSTTPDIYNTITINVDTVLNSIMSLGTRSSEINFDVWDYATGSISSAVNNNNLITYYSFDIKNTLTSNDEDALANITLATWARVNGSIGTQVMQTNTRYVQSTSADLDVKWINSVIYGTPTGNINYNISTTLNTEAPVGWECLCVRNGGTGNIRLIADGGITIVTSPANPETAGDGGWFTVKKIDTNTWFCGGDIQNTGSSAALINVYVSQLIGNDTTGDGTLLNPFATVGKAMTFIGNPANPVNIVILDGATYNETITFNYHVINILGQDATLNCTTGDTLVVASALPGTIYVNVGTLASAGGNSINMNGEDGGSANLIVDAGFINAGPVVTTSTYVCFLRAAKIAANLNTTAGGSINYVTTDYTGTDSGTTVSGISPAGTEGTFKIGANTFAKTDATAGYVWTTNGSGSSSLQPPSGGGSGITWNGVSGTTQTAAVNNGYIIQNASATTISLPATAPIGSIVYVQGLGAGGWILGAHSGQTIQVGDVATSSGGSLSSANQWDAIGVVCVVANTTWAMLPPVTSGFSIF